MGKKKFLYFDLAKLHFNGCVQIFHFLLYRYVEENTLMNNYAHIFDLLTRLRQVNDYSNGTNRKFNTSAPYD